MQQNFLSSVVDYCISIFLTCKYSDVSKEQREQLAFITKLTEKQIKDWSALALCKNVKDDWAERLLWSLSRLVVVEGGVMSGMKASAVLAAVANSSSWIIIVFGYCNIVDFG